MMPAKKKIIKKEGLLKELKRISAPKTAFPSRLLPMLATRVNESFDDEDWLFEIKWDGVRIISYIRDGSVSLLTRKFQDYTNVYHTITESLKALPYSAVLDGEVIMLDEDGKPSFDALQNVRRAGAERLMFCVFDVLWLEGYNLMQVPLVDRSDLVKKIIPSGLKNIFYYPYVRGKGKELFRKMQEIEYEGIVAKKLDSVYEPGKRVKTWLKIPTHLRQEFVIAGWTESEKGRPFRSLLFGYYKNSDLVFFGHSGGGFKEKEAEELKKKMVKIEIRKRPFVNDPGLRARIHWIRPKIVGEFEYATVTKGGKIRKPAIFKGIRTDKALREILLEKAVPVTPGILNGGTDSKRKKSPKKKNA